MRNEDNSIIRRSTHQTVKSISESEKSYVTSSNSVMARKVSMYASLEENERDK